MKEIEFRGISYESNKFVYGWLHQTKYKCKKFFIRTFPNEDDEYDDVIVNINTVGQYTGLTDKYGIKIFEGDIVRYGDTVYQVVFDEEDCRFELLDNTGGDSVLGNWRERYYVVLGNIYENPELLEVQDEDEDDDEFWKVLETLDTIDD